MTLEISDYISAHQYMTVACIDDQGFLYCFNCFYCFEENNQLLLFASSPHGTHHVNLLRTMSQTSGSILPNCMPVKYILGLQFTGHVVQPDDLDLDFQNLYRLKFPVSVHIPHEIWGIKMDFVKLTDNSKGFGYKNIWKRGSI